MIISPCISICKTDPQTGYCYGCGRNNEEKKLWKIENTSDQWKKDNLTNIQNRLVGWQLESFKNSYKHKIENGISLFKKNLNNESINNCNSSLYNWSNFWSFNFRYVERSNKSKSFVGHWMDYIIINRVIFNRKK